MNLDIDVKKLVKVSLHLGAHKTASTHFQQTLKANQNVFTRSSVRYLGPSDLRGKGKSIQSRLGLRNSKTAGQVRATDELDRIADGADRVVFSEENFLGSLYAGNPKQLTPLYPKADLRLERFAEALEGHSISVFLAVRDPATYLASCYSQMFLRGTYMPFKDFAPDIDPALIKWSNLIDRLRRVAGVDQLFVWRYEDYPEVAVEVTRRMIHRRFGKWVQPLDKQVNIGLSQKAVAHVLSMSDTNVGKKLGSQARVDFPVTDDSPRFDPWTPQQRQESALAYEADLNRIQSLDNVTLIRVLPN